MREISVIEVNLSDLDHNMQVIRQIVGPSCALCPIVKADAYGLGAARIAKRMVHHGAELLAVYTPDQAAELFRAAVGCRVLVLMPVREIARVDELYRGLVADRLQLTIHDMDHISDLIAITERFGVTIAVHLEIDTGMSRGGCSVADVPAILERIASCRRLHLAGIFTHFASPETPTPFTDTQLQQFEHLLEQHAALIPADCRIHVASTFSMLRHERFHKSMVRFGLAWAGYGLEWMNSGEIIAEAQQLRPVMTWKSRVVQVKTIDKHTPVGYGSVWTSKRPSVIGLVPVGYADGYPAGIGVRDNQPKGAMVRVLTENGDSDSEGGSGGGSGGAWGYAPVVGAVNMDQITIDLTDIAQQAASCGQAVGVGTVVELITADAEAPNHLPRLAKMAGTHPHELLCRLNSRIKRSYTTSIVGLDRSEGPDALAI